MLPWILSAILGACAVIVSIYMIKRMQKRHAPRTEENEIILGDSPDGPVVRKGDVDTDNVE